MRVEHVGFFSEGIKLAGVLKKPEGGAGPFPTIVQGPGWLALANSPTSQPYHERFVSSGYAVLVVDYRGFGDSDGDRGWVRPEHQLEDIFSAMTYVETRDDLDESRLGIFGLGGTGGGNAIMACALDPRPKCAIAQTVVADGREWARQMRREHEWIEFIERVEANRRRRVLMGTGEIVDPRTDLMVASPERKAESSRTATDAITGDEFYLASAESLLRYRPIDVVDRIAPRGLLLTSVERDVVTPEDHACALFARAGEPKMLIRQTGVRHYESYRKNFEKMVPRFVAWYDRFLKNDGGEDGGDSGVITI